ncbi:SMI1/KNR4 family protein [Flavobacterium psychroterrae]|uniref:SMI1/KNR4 family protein n=1 Tax=Flavobacterium psychroterrae TaxID=2133767 RepID=A0ABS5PDF8_9FLAO|nr:SMI1/KNR4 family protein [Flavobacterium psychroterrae]MBS7232316.1 SMI1/KNR4 family protein [Flavobacterium psychroterrae]
MTNKLIDQLNKAFKSKLDIFDTLMNDGASEKEISDLEKLFNQTLPKSYIDLLKVYNGEKEILGVMAGFGFLEIEDVKIQWNFFKTATAQTEPDSIYQKNKIKNQLYSVKRIPFAHDGSGNLLCIDYDPNIEGKSGQILYLPTGDPEPVSVIADDFDEFLAFLIDAVRTEKLKLTDEREEWDEEDWQQAEIYFHKSWKDDWTDIADEYNLIHTEDL